MLRQCIGKAENPLELGQTLAGEPFGLEIAALDTVNIIAGAKGSGASHLANVFVAELIAHGAPCVVFDTRGTHAGLSLDSQNASKRREGDAAIVHLVAGESLRLGVQQFDLHALLTILRQFGLPRATALYFASHVTRRLVQSQAPADAAPPPSLLGIDDLIHLAHDLESGGQAVVGGAVLSCLEAIKKTQILAAQPAEAMALWNSYAQICNGGALVIDLSRLPIRAQTAVVQALVCLLRDRIERKIVTESTPAPFMFFDDAQPLVTRHFIAEVVTAARQHGLTSFFVTTMATGLDDTLLHEADNLFLLQMVSDADVRHLAKSGLVDQETLHAVVRRLPRYQSMVIGSATGGYPIIFAGGACGGVAISEKRAASLRAPAVATVQRAQTPARTDPSLPLFPDDTPGRAVASESRARRRISQSPQPQAPTLAQLTATWHHVVKRTARRRRILETILSAARPLRIAGSKLVLSFPPQHRFQQELIESDEYRRLLEEELKNTFGVSLEVTTELHPA
jgi:hypothetical protein